MSGDLNVVFSLSSLLTIPAGWLPYVPYFLSESTYVIAVALRTKPAGYGTLDKHHGIVMKWYYIHAWIHTVALFWLWSLSTLLHRFSGCSYWTTAIVYDIWIYSLIELQYVYLWLWVICSHVTVQFGSFWLKPNTPEKCRFEDALVWNEIPDRAEHWV